MSSELWSIPRLWPGATVVIIAGGPSLSFRQLRHIARARLEGRCRVIAINDQIYFAWWSDWCHGCDAKWWNHHIQSLQHFTGIKTTLDEGVPPGWGVHRLGNADEKGVRGGFVDDPTRVRTGGNGAFQASGAAVHAGARRILLTGVDMRRGPNGETHCHGGHPEGTTLRTNTPYEVSMLPWWATLVEPMRERGVEIVNCSPGSAVTCFPVATIEGVL